MADLVRDDIGLRELARRVEALRKLAEELGVEVDVLVGRAVERPHCGLRRAASGLIALRVSDQLRRRVADALRLEQIGPCILGRSKDLEHEMTRVRVQRALSSACALLGDRRNASATPAQPSQRTQQEIADHEDNHAANPEAAGDQRQ